MKIQSTSSSAISIITLISIMEALSHRSAVLSSGNLGYFEGIFVIIPATVSPLYNGNTGRSDCQALSQNPSILRR